MCTVLTVAISELKRVLLDNLSLRSDCGLHTVAEGGSSAPAISTSTPYRHGLREGDVALWRAVRAVLPRVKLQGCYFHYTQAVWRHVQKLGKTDTIY